MFAILVVCIVFFRRALTGGRAQANARAMIHVVRRIAFFAAMALMDVDYLTDNALSAHFDRFTFRSEAAGLVAFGIASLTASRILPLITRADERLSLKPDAR